MRGYLLYAAVMSSVCAAPAFAQSVPGATDPSAPAPETGVRTTPNTSSNANAPAAPQAATVGEVVVTAQRRAENLQNVPIAVNAVSGAALANSGVANITDLKIAVPGVNVQVSNGFETTHLRGVGSTAIGPGLENPIALYVDGVYYGFPVGNAIDFVSVSQVEVLKGPQGTLFGRNATGGLIQVITKDPGQTPHLDLQAGYGNYDTSQVSGYVSGPLTSKLAADFAVQASHQGDGYGTNFFNGKDVNKTDIDLTLRSKVIYRPVDGTKITLIMDYSQNRNSDNAFRFTPGEVATPLIGPAYGGSPWDVDSNVQPLSYTQNGGISIKIDQDLGFANLMNLVAYRETNNKLIFDLDDTATPFENAYLIDRDHALSEELQLQSKHHEKYNWVVGAFYYHDDGKYAPGSDVTFLGAFNPAAPLTGISPVGNEDTQSVAVYGQGTYEILPKTNLTFGARYTYERRELEAYEEGLVGNTYNPVNGDIGPGISIGDLATASKAKDFYRPTFRVSLDHRFSDEVLAYASFNTGFKSGGFNTQVPTDPAFAAETLDAYEVGIKTDLLNRRLRVNVSTFYYNYTNLQVEILELASSGITNGAGAYIYGGDVDIEAVLTDNLRVTAGTELLNAKFTQFPDAPYGSFDGTVPLHNASAGGNHLPVSPTAVLNLTADYKFNAFGFPMNANVTYQYNSGWYPEPDNLVQQPDFSLLNASLRWKSMDGRYSLQVYGNNLVNEAVQNFETTAVIGAHETSYLPPRTYGFKVGYAF